MILSKSPDIIKISKRVSKSQEFEKKTISLIGFDILIYHDIIKNLMIFSKYLMVSQDIKCLRRRLYL